MKFKEGDIVVYTGTGNTYLGDNNTIWRTPKVTMNRDGCYNLEGKIWSAKVRHATENEIIWFKIGINNINQIPEIGGTFGSNGDKEIVSIRNNKIYTKRNGVFTFYYWFKQYGQTYKPPITSNKKFIIGDLFGSKIQNLTKEDHEIIQPFLFDMGYRWNSGCKTVQYLDGKTPYLFIGTNTYFYKKPDRESSKAYFDKNSLKEIKKEDLIHYINNQKKEVNHESSEDKKTITKPINRAITGKPVRIPTITGRVASSSRLIGNKATARCKKSRIKQTKIQFRAIST